MATVTCCAYNCGNKYGREGITFHRFPLDKPHILSKWLVSMGKPKWAPTKDNFLCSDHFTEEMFNEKGGYRFVKYDAIPTKFYVLPSVKELFPAEFPYKIIVNREVEQDFSKGYVIEAKINIETEEQFHTWLKEHEKLAKVNYRLVKSFPKAATKNLAFKAQFLCRFGSGTFTTPESGSCPAKLLVRIRSPVASKFGRPKDEDSSGYSCTVLIYHLHFHKVDSNQFNESIVTADDVSEEVRQKYMEMFNGGYSAEQALSMHQRDITEDYAEQSSEIMADHYNCPNMEWVQKSYEKFLQESGAITGEKVMESIEKELSAINAEEGKAKMSRVDDDIVVAICTPLMQRVHSLKASGESVFVAGSGLMDRCKCYVYVFMAYGFSEGLPLGILISTSENEKVLTAGVNLLAGILPDRAFGQYGKIGPEIFLASNNDAEQASLKNVFPDSVLSLCCLSLLKELWCWLWDSNNNIAEEDRPLLFSLTHKIMKTTNADEFNDCFSSALQNQTVAKYENFLTYFKQITNLSEKWALKFGNQIIDTEKEVSAIEMASIVLKDRIFMTRAYNMPQLIRFMAKDLEAYYKQKIIHFINNSLEKFVHSSYRPEMRLVDGLVVEELPTGLYKVINQKYNVAYYVDSHISLCSCVLGLVGARCKHQYAVSLKKPVSGYRIPEDDVIKNELHWVATNSMNSLFGSMEPHSSPAVDQGYDEMDDEEYDPRNETQRRFKPKAKRAPVSAKDNDKAILDRVVKDIMQRYDRNPTEYHKAIVAIAVNYQSLHHDHAVLAALRNFGKNIA